MLTIILTPDSDKTARHEVVNFFLRQKNKDRIELHVLLFCVGQGQGKD